jgi:hypothetical protein
MAVGRKVILSVAAALSALTNPLPATDANAAGNTNEAITSRAAAPSLEHANTFVAVGLDLLAFTINEQADGTIVAQHRSHASHASHSSHSSHYSSR